MMKSGKFICFCFLFVVIQFELHAQNDPHFTQYMQNRLLLSPGFAGSNSGLDAAATFRFQNIGLSNRLTSAQVLCASASVDAIKGGAGFCLINDMIGLQRSTMFSVNYAYQKRIKDMNIGIGAGVGFVNYGIDGSKIITPEGAYVSAPEHNDPNLPVTKASSTSPDFSLGIYFGNKKYYASLSVNHLYAAASVKGTESSFVFNYDRNLVISGGYDFTATKNLGIQPSVMLRTNFQKVQTDISVLLSVYTYITTGFSVRGYDSRSIDAFCLFFGGNVKGFTIMYSYDANLSFQRSFNSGTHEFSVKYHMPFKVRKLDGKFYHNSRYM